MPEGFAAKTVLPYESSIYIENSNLPADNGVDSVSCNGTNVTGLCTLQPGVHDVPCENYIPERVQHLGS